MSWNMASGIAEAVGAFIAAGSLIAVFWVYRTAKRDDTHAGFRRVVASNRADIERLDGLLDYELAHDMAWSVLQGAEMNVVLEEVYEKFFNASTNNNTASDEVNAAQLKEYLDQHLPPITTPIYTSHSNLYEGLVHNIETSMAPYQVDFPSLYRVTRAVSRLFSNILRTYKQNAQEERLWKRTIEWAYANKDGIDSLAELKVQLLVLFVGLIEETRKETTQKRIDELVAALDIVMSAYLGRNEKDLAALSKQERKISMKPVYEHNTVTALLDDAKPGLDRALDRSALNRYTALIDNFEDSFEEGSELQESVPMS